MIRMQLNSSKLWVPRLSAFGVAALIAASAAYWVLRWPDASDAGISLGAVSDSSARETFTAAELKALAHVLGADKSTATDRSPSGLAARLALSGVVTNAAGSGAALISVDGKPARSYVVGSRVIEGLVLKELAPRRAMLAASVEAPVGLTLEMKPPAQ